MVIAAGGVTDADELTRKILSKHIWPSTRVVRLRKNPFGDFW
jgi:hypothetical protein